MRVGLAQVFVLDDWIFVEILMQFFTFKKELLFILLVVDNNLNIRTFLNMLFNGIRH